MHIFYSNKKCKEGKKAGNKFTRPQDSKNSNLLQTPRYNQFHIGWAIQVI